VRRECPKPYRPPETVQEVRAAEWAEDHIRPLIEAARRLERAVHPGHGDVSVLDADDRRALAYILQTLSKKEAT
jgi:hypothetical protein